MKQGACGMKGKDGLLLCFHHVLCEEKDVQLLG